MELKLVAATYEVQKGEFMYRISTGEGGTIIRRLKIEPGVQLWSHGTLVYTYDAISDAFEPQTIALPKKFTSVEEAVEAIENYTNIKDTYNHYS